MDRLFQIRPAGLADVPVIRQLIPQSARGLGGGFYTREQTEAAIMHVFGVDTQLIIDGTYFVAEGDGRIVACGGWSRRLTLFGGDQMKSSVDPLLDPQKDAARIRAFFVHPDFARRGIATQLIEHCERAARAAGFSRMELAATLPGVPLYAARSYQVIERIDARLPGGVDLPIIRMGKPL